MPEALQNLIRALARLPGLGRRSAERMAYRMLLGDRKMLLELQDALQQAQAELGTCARCGNLCAKDEELCAICRNPHRDPRLLCIVEGASDLLWLEQSGGFDGRYFCLQGKVSPRLQETVSRERLESLLERIREDGVTEVVLALNTDVESDATASMLAEWLAPLDLTVSRLAFGLPSGSGLAYSDPVTLQRALQGRQRL